MDPSAEPRKLTELLVSQTRMKQHFRTWAPGSTVTAPSDELPALPGLPMILRLNLESLPELLSFHNYLAQTALSDLPSHLSLKRIHFSIQINSKENRDLKASLQ